MIEEKDIIEAGKFLKPHGLKGELNAVLEYPAEILESDYPLIVSMDGIFVPFYAESVRPKGHFSSLIKLQGVDSVEEARKFVNHNFYFRRSDVAEFLNMDVEDIQTEDDFVGYKVYDKNLGYLGVVEELDASTENVLLLVRPESDDDEEAELLYIPFNDELIDNIEEDEETGEGEIHFDLPKGILDLNS